MNKLKKLVSVVLAGAMILAMSVSAFAAEPGITASEQEILNAAQAQAERLGVVGTAKYDKYMSQARTYLASNELSDSQAKAMVQAVNNAADKTVAELNGRSLADLSDAEFTSLFNSIAADVKTAAAEVGITLVISANGEVSALALPKDNATDKGSDKGTTVNPPSVVGSTVNVIKQTGTDLAADKVNASVSIDTTASMTTTVVMVVMFVGAVAVCGMVAKKKDLFSSLEA